jgi:uncharacterized protein YjeT (DUF2065 family)
MKLFLSALGLALILEGLPYALAPATVRRMAEVLPHLSDQFLKTLGVVVMGIGIMVIAFGRLGSVG